jgi:hypothetical protein
MSKVERRPASGAGSCARCQDSLGLASIKVDGGWYCSTGCAEGRATARSKSDRVPEPWLYARPRRFFHKRRPKELHSSSSETR